MSGRPTPSPDRPGAARRPRRVEVHRAPDGRLAVRFDYAADLIACVKRIPGRRWHGRARCWTIPAEPGTLGYLVSRCRNEDLLLEAGVERLLPKSGLDGVSWRRIDPGESAVREAWRASLRRMRDQLTIRGYSPRTRHAYLDQIRRFLRTTGAHPADLGPGHVQEYLRRILEERGLSHSYANQNVSALKFYFARALRRPLDDVDLPRPKPQRKLPTVLSGGEMRAVFEAVENRKHRAILMLVYAAGLRVGEVVRLKVADVDAERGTLHIRQAKGRKDRIVPLSRVALEALRLYRRYQPSEGPWLFPGQRRGRHLSERAVQHVFAKARNLAGITKPATVHTLRHSFATHLHEAGIGLRYIQTLLGHRSSRTTEIYTHVSRADLANIKSPLDRLMDASALESTDDRE